MTPMDAAVAAAILSYGRIVDPAQPIVLDGETAQLIFEQVIARAIDAYEAAAHKQIVGAP